MPIKKPGAYVHPKRKDQPAQTLDPEARPAEPAPKPRPVRRSPAAQATKLSNEKTEQFRLVVYPPVEGQIPLYDEMIKAGILSNRVLLGLLKKGFGAFEADLLAGKITAENGEFETHGKPIDTTRNVSPRFVAVARETFDPFGILSDRALGRCVAETILRNAQK